MSVGRRRELIEPEHPLLSILNQAYPSRNSVREMGASSLRRLRVRSCSPEAVHRLWVETGGSDSGIAVSSLI